jgi:hypothetical protein
MRYWARIAYNSRNWERPSGDAERLESRTYNSSHGFGHEEWLFRNEWVIDEWRYAFLQGVNGSKQVAPGGRFDVTLFTRPDAKRRLFVADILNVERLDEFQASEAVGEFKGRGWFGEMMREVEGVNGNADALRDYEHPTHVLNIRYHAADVALYPAGSYAGPDDRPSLLKRYQLVRWSPSDEAKLAVPSTGDDEEWSEGKLALVTHLRRERAQGLSAAKKADVLATTGKLLCERCGFDPVEQYGDDVGEACIEVHHHMVRVADMKDGHVTRLADLQCLCANCHRVVHRELKLKASLRG